MNEMEISVLMMKILESVVATLKEQPRGAELLVAEDLNMKLS